MPLHSSLDDRARLWLKNKNKNKLRKPSQKVIPKLNLRFYQDIKDKKYHSQAPWLKPVIPALWEAKVDRSLETRLAGQHGNTLSLLIIQKLAGCGGACL